MHLSQESFWDHHHHHHADSFKFGEAIEVYLTVAAEQLINVLNYE